MAKILIAIPMAPNIHPHFRAKCSDLATQFPANNPGHEFTVIIDQRKIERVATDVRPWSAVARARNALLDAVNLTAFDLVLWIDADVVEYPLDMPTRLAAAVGDGIVAPMILVENDPRFYDWGAFVVKGASDISPNDMHAHGWHPGQRQRQLMQYPPFWKDPPTTELVEMDCVGTVLMVHADIYRDGARHEDHPAFTDHWSVCKAARDAGKPVVCHRGVTARHADLPKYGIAWH